MVNFLKALFKPPSNRSRKVTTTTRTTATTTYPYNSTDSRLIQTAMGNSSQIGGRLGAIIASSSDAIGTCQTLLSSNSTDDSSIHHITRIIALLEAQRRELFDMRPYVERRRFPTLLTLHEIYSKLGTSLQDVQSMPPTVARDTLETLVQVLQEGPDYLIDIILISAIISQAEMIDTSYASDLRHILDRAIDSQTDLETFRRATEAIASVSSGIPTHLLDNQQAEEAYEAIAVLVKQLQVRVATSVNLTPTPASSIAGSGTVTPVQSPLVSATTSPAVSPTPSVSSSTSSTPSDPNFKSMDISDLQANYGTGVRAPASPLPGLSSYRPSPAPSTPKPAAATPATPDTSSETSQEIWEYRDQLLTRSALDLVLAQEALAQADSSGQYAGEVSWDDLRKAWIPKWVEKLKPGDLADDDEVPDLTPGGFKIKTKDEWGNKIGWYGPHKEMYYEEEPKFELKEK